MKKLLVGLLSLGVLYGCQFPQQEPPNKAVVGLGDKLTAAIANLAPPKTTVLPQNLKFNSKTTTVKIFHADRQCEKLVPETEQLPNLGSNEKMVAVTLENVLERQRIANFKVSQYKVTLDNGLAVIDIDVDPTSERKIASLSSCEQFALFKAIEATLIKNKFLDVYEVKFTQSGEEVYL